MPESVRDRCTKSHEYIFLLSKSKHYYFDAESIQETAKCDGRKDTINKGSLKYDCMDALPFCSKTNTMTMAGACHERWRFENGRAVRNKRDVWSVSTGGFKGAHFAVYPEKLITPCVLAGSKRGGIVLDPFCGSGTTLKVADDNGRHGIGIELNEQYAEIIRERIGEYERK